MVDLIHHHVELPVTDDDLDRAAPMRVGSVVVPVQSATDLLVDRLLLLGSGRFDLTGPLALARALREQINWTVVRAETCGSAGGYVVCRTVRDTIGVWRYNGS